MTKPELSIAPAGQHLPTRDHPLRVWRKYQFVDGPDGRRAMRLQDIEDKFGIPVSTWAGWEQWPGAPTFRRPDEANMQRIFEITGGKVTPEDYYPISQWKAALEAEASD